jgi:hypothetical protein
MPSAIINRIKTKMWQLVECIKEKYHTERKRQDKVSEILTPETVLPP